MFPMTPIAAALALLLCSSAFAAPTSVDNTPRSLLAQAKGLPAEFEEHFFDVPLAVRIELDQQPLGEAMIVLSRDDRVTLLDFTDTSESHYGASERDTWADILKPGVTLGTCTSQCPEQMLAVHYNLENSLLSVITENAERDSEAKRFYDQPEGGSSGLMVRNQLNLNGGQDQDLGGRLAWRPAAAWATGARRSTCNWRVWADRMTRPITRCMSSIPSVSWRAAFSGWVISLPTPKA
ncbi:hypothetical protein ACFQD2_24480 [Pseudomonas lini]